MSKQEKVGSLGERMKEYEKAARVILEPRLPVILRVDGKAFHTYLKSIEAHTDSVNEVMDGVAIELCKSIQGAQLAYVQSDEASVLIHSYKRENSSAWFDNQVQKMVSVASSIASVKFTLDSYKIFAWKGWENHPDTDTMQFIKTAHFDARVFTLPEEEVCNYFIWRQQDGIRNSISGQARRFFSHKMLEHRDQREMKEMLFFKGQPWEELPVAKQRGRCVFKVNEERDPGVIRSTWVVDTNVPLFVDDRVYVDRHLAVEQEESK